MVRSHTVWSSKKGSAFKASSWELYGETSHLRKNLFSLLLIHWISTGKRNLEFRMMSFVGSLLFDSHWVFETRILQDPGSGIQASDNYGWGFSTQRHSQSATQHDGIAHLLLQSLYFWRLIPCSIRSNYQLRELQALSSNRNIFPVDRHNLNQRRIFLIPRFIPPNRSRSYRPTGLDFEVSGWGFEWIFGLWRWN